MLHRVLVCDPRKNNLGKVGNKNDRNDARELAELLHGGKLRSVYHGEHGIRTLKELSRSYMAIARSDAGDESPKSDLPKLGDCLYWSGCTHPATVQNDWRRLPKLECIRRAEFYYPQLDALAALRQQARRELLNESRKHFAVKLLRQIPSIAPSAPLCCWLLIQTPHRFRTKRQFWAYIGLALKTYGSGEYRFVGSQLKRSKKAVAIRGLNLNPNHDLKNIFKGAATWAAASSGPFRVSTKLVLHEE